MRKKKLFTHFLPLVLSLGIVVGGSIVATNKSVTEASIADGDYVQGTYHLGEDYVPPKDIKIEYNGQSYSPTSIYCVYPSGTTVSGRWFRLSEYGQYTFVYEAKVDGKYISAKQYLSVKKDQYYFATSKSTLSYGSLDQSYQNCGYSDGLCLDMAENDVFYVSEPMNIYEQDISSIINFKCVQRGDAVVKYMNVRITDCYDPDIYIDISLKRGSYEYERYVQAGFKGSGMVGLITSGTGLINIDNVLYSIDSNGTSITSSYKYIDENNMTINSAHYYFDNSNKERPRIYVETEPTRSYKLVREFNNPDISQSYFPGFTNGNVYLTLTVSSFNGVNSAPMQIASINGKSGKGLLPMDYYEDKNAPIISINTPSLENEILGGMPVTVPSAEVVDDTGVRGTYSASVWYNYDLPEERKNVNASYNENGQLVFTPQRLGVYTIEYKATDVYGNVATKLLKMKASSYGTTAFDFSPSKVKDGVKAGTPVRFDEYKMNSINDITDIYVEVTDPSGVVSRHELNKPYFLSRAGQYKVTYHFEDAFYSDNYTYNFRADNSTVPSFEREIIPTPNAFIANATYSLADVAAYLYNENGTEPVDVDYAVSYNGGAFENVSNKNKFTIPADKAGQTIRFKYTSHSDSSVYITSEEKKVVDTNFTAGSRLAQEKYFIGDFEGSATSNSVSYIAKKSGTGSLAFVNNISLSNFDFQLLFAKTSKFSGFNIVLEDYLNPSTSHVISFTGTNTVAVDGKECTELRTEYQGSGATLNVDYSINEEKLSVGDSTFTLTNDFESDLVKMRLDFTGLVAEDTTLQIFKLCNQKFNNATRDQVQPLLVTSEIKNVAVIDDTITVPVPTVIDMLSPSSLDNCVLNCRYDGRAITADDGTVLSNIVNPKKEYSFGIGDYGNYYITYVFTDGFNNKVQKQYTVYVFDIIAPELTLSAKTDKQSAGDAVPTLAVTVSDNVSAEENIRVYYVAYDSRSRFVDSCERGKTLTIQESGTYTVYVYAMDEAGNTAYASYTLYCK